MLGTAKDKRDTQTIDMFIWAVTKGGASSGPIQKSEDKVKEFRFINKQSLKEFKALPDHIQKRFAADLNEICKGKPPFSKSKYLTESVGAGAIELIENGRPAYRTVYVAKFKEAVYILHSFTKTTNGIDRKAMGTAKKRYKDMLAEQKK